VPRREVFGQVVESDHSHSGFPPVSHRTGLTLSITSI
jgi:hypothetical protein